MAEEKCPICDAEFKSAEEFERHNREEHPDASGQGARPIAEERQREPGAAGGAPGGNPVVDTNTGEIRNP